MASFRFLLCVISVALFGFEVSGSQACCFGGDGRNSESECKAVDGVNEFRTVRRIDFGQTSLIRYNVENFAEKNNDNARVAIFSFMSAVKALTELNDRKLFPVAAEFNEKVAKEKYFNFYNLFVSKHGASDLSPHLVDFSNEVLSMCSTEPQASVWQDCRHHEDKENHDKPLFLLWHRAFVRSFEISANSIANKSKNPNQYFGVPYWNWIDSPKMPSILRDDVTKLSCISSIKQEKDPICNSSRSGPANRGENVWKNITGINGLVFGKKNIGSPDFVDFTYNLESMLHDRVHAGVGPHMGRSDTAVTDVAFWLLHSYVDKLFIEWAEGRISRKSNDQNLEDLKTIEELKKRWDAEKIRFPMLCGNEFVWYQPDFDEVSPWRSLGNYPQKLGYEFDRIDPNSNYEDPQRSVSIVAADNALAQKSSGRDYFIEIDDNLKSIRANNYVEVNNGKFTVDYGGATRIKISLDNLLKKLKIYVKKSNLKPIRIRKRSFLVEFNDISYYPQPSGNNVVGVFFRFCGRNLHNIGDYCQRWKFTTFLNSFARVGQANTFKTHDQRFDFTESFRLLVKDGIKKSGLNRSNFYSLSELELEIGMVPLLVEDKLDENFSVWQGGERKKEGNGLVDFDAIRLFSPLVD